MTRRSHCSKLAIVGEIDHIAQGEDIRSVADGEGGGDGTYGTNMTFSGLIVYDVSVDDGFRELGRVDNPQRSDGLYDSSLCTNRWSNASSEVKRSVFIDDFVYALSATALHVQDTRAMDSDVATLSLAVSAGTM